MERKYSKLAKGIYMIGNNVFFRQMVEGKRVLEKAPIQGLLAVDQRGNPTKELKRIYQNWALKRINEKWELEHSDVRVPTFKDLIEAYQKAASEEQIKNDGRPTDRTISNTKKAFTSCIEGCGLNMSDKITKMDCDTLERYFITAVKSGKKRITVWSYVMSAKAITAKWALPHYRRQGLAVKSMEIPKIKNHKGCRYERPTEETRRDVAKWYEKLWSLDDKRLWMGATLMLQFAMRNSDARLAKWDWFTEREGTIYVRYVPIKTKNSSARHVVWPVHPDVWRKMLQARKEIDEPKSENEAGLLLPGGSYVYVQLNASLRDSVPGLKNSEKACYELRKLRIDAEYRKYGAERASALSGDSINTITYYYADVADVATAPTKAEEMII